MPKVTQREFERQVKDKNFSKLYFIYGDDVYNIACAKDALIKQIVENRSNSFDYSEIDGQNFDIYKLGLSLEQYPINAIRKCVLIKNLDVDLLSSNELEELYSILSDIPEYCSLIVCQTTIKIDNKSSSKWKKTVSLMEKIGVVLKIDTQIKTSIEKETVKLANKRNKVLSFKNASLICNLCGNDLLKIKNEIDKVCAFEENEEISKDSIERVVTGNFETNVFEMCKMLTAGRYCETFKILHSLFFQKEEPIAILSVISSVYVDMYRVKVAVQSGLPGSYIADVFDYKRKEFKIKIAEKNIVNISMDSLKKIIEILVQVDLKLKSSRVNPQIILELALVKIMLLQNNR